MGKRGLPPLQRHELVAILIAAGFVLQTGAGHSGRHDSYEAIIYGQRRVVSVSRSYNEFSGDILKSIIRQSGMSKDHFYGMTAATASKAQCAFLREGLPQMAP